MKLSTLICLLLTALALGPLTRVSIAQTHAVESAAVEAQRHLSRGIQLASQNRFKSARLELETADALDPGDFAILFNLGQVQLRLNDNSVAEVSLSRALKLKPASAETLFLLAQAESNQSRPLDALDLLVRARELAPANVDILLLMAQIGIAQKYYEDAIPLLEKAASLAPTRADIATTLGQAYFKADKVDNSIAVFNQLVHTQPSAVAYVYLGFAHTYLGRFDDAKQDFRAGLKLEPNNDVCLFQLGYIAKLQGDTATAEQTFLHVLRLKPDQASALLELASIRMEQRRYQEAVTLLQHHVRVSSSPATGYYKLAMAEKNVHDTAAAQRDLAHFQALSKDAPAVAHPYDKLFDYLDNRSRLPPDARRQQDLASLVEQAKLHPDRPDVLYALADAYLKGGQIEPARQTIADLDALRPEDVRTLTALGVLLARYSLFDDAIAQFQTALKVQPQADDANFDLANALFRKGSYPEALAAAQAVSGPARNDDTYAALLADIDAHLGQTAQAEALYRSALERNPDNDQAYLSLALLQLRQNQIAAAKSTLTRGQARVPGSGKLLWGLGLTALLTGDTANAAKNFERAVDLLPEWPGSYSTLGFFYFQTGQIDKAREVLDRFKNSGARGGLDIARIEDTLAHAPAVETIGDAPLPVAQRTQIFQFAAYLADKTL